MQPLISLLFLLSLASVSNADTQPPNILFISIDDLRPELGCYGDSVAQTPHLDKLAKAGLRFDRAYCNVAVCGASRASMLTGILPTTTRFVDYLATIDKDTPQALTLPEHFKKNGYTTVAHGKILHNARDAADRSWSRPVQYPKISHKTHRDPESVANPEQADKPRFYESPDVEDDAYIDGLIANSTINDLRRLKEEGKPFFLGCGFIRPHLPFYAPKKYWDLYEGDQIPLASNRFLPKEAPQELRGSREYQTYDLAGYDPTSDDFHRKMRHGYLASTSYVDALVGRVLKELTDLELDQNTIVIVWGDHGWHLGEHTFWGKHNTLHLATRIPLIMKVPGKISGASCEALVQSVDLFPTLCSLAGIEIPASVQGQSFGPLFDNPEATHNDEIYNRFKKADAIITSRFTYSRFQGGSEMLFDLQKDPQENTNLASREDHLPTIETMRSKLDQAIQTAESAQW